MIIDAVSKASRSRFKTLIADVQSLPTHYDNQKFTVPENTRWCRLTVLPGDTEQADMGTPAKRWRTSGVVVAQLFSPLEQGDENILQLADLIAETFRGKTVAPAIFRSPSIVRVGRAGPWWQVNVSCPWFADEIGA